MAERGVWRMRCCDPCSYGRSKVTSSGSFKILSHPGRRKPELSSANVNGVSNIHGGYRYKMRLDSSLFYRSMAIFRGFHAAYKEDCCISGGRFDNVASGLRSTSRLRLGLSLELALGLETGLRSGLIHNTRVVKARASGSFFEFNKTPARDRKLDFGAHKGKWLGTVPPKYLKWIVKEGFKPESDKVEVYNEDGEPVDNPLDYWAAAAKEVLSDSVYRDRIEWEEIWGDSKIEEAHLWRTKEKSFGWIPRENTEAWRGVDYRLLGTSFTKPIPRLGSGRDRKVILEKRKASVKQVVLPGVENDLQRRRAMRRRRRLMAEQEATEGTAVETKGFGIEGKREEEEEEEEVAREVVTPASLFPGRQGMLSQFNELRTKSRDATSSEEKERQGELETATRAEGLSFISRQELAGLVRMGAAPRGKPTRGDKGKESDGTRAKRRTVTRSMNEALSNELLRVSEGDGNAARDDTQANVQTADGERQGLLARYLKPVRSRSTIRRVEGDESEGVEPSARSSKSPRLRKTSRSRHERDESEGGESLLGEAREARVPSASRKSGNAVGSLLTKYSKAAKSQEPLADAGVNDGKVQESPVHTGGDGNSNVAGNGERATKKTSDERAERKKGKQGVGLKGLVHRELDMVENLWSSRSSEV